jgi:hypothetical protein
MASRTPSLTGHKPPSPVVENPIADIPINSIEIDEGFGLSRHPNADYPGSSFEAIPPAPLLYRRSPGPYPKPQEIQHAIVVEEDNPSHRKINRIRY